MAKKKAKLAHRSGSAPRQQETTAAPTQLTETERGVCACRPDGTGLTVCGLRRVNGWRYGNASDVTCEACRG